MELVKYEAACRALAEANTVDEVKVVKDKATALQLYAKQANNKELEIHSAEIRFRAKVRLGEISKELETAKNQHGTALPSSGKSKKEALKQAHISTSEANRCEQLADVPKKEREAYLATRRGKGEPASAGQLATTLTAKAKRKRKQKELDSLDLNKTNKYKVIYADPPWDYGDKRTGLKGYSAAADHYPPMTIQELCDLPVKDITIKDAVLFMWVTSPLLEECFYVINGWGFKYKASFVWDKVGHNVGHYNSVRHEFLLICTKGSCTPDIKTLHDSVVEIKKTKTHSEKPEHFRELIDKMYTSGKRIELFRRGGKIKKWDMWGNESSA